MSKKKAELKTTTDIVADILQHHPKARNSDEYLYYKVCEKVYKEATELPFWYVMLNRKELKLPSYETVSRARRKLQEACPSLLGDEAVIADRRNNEEVFKDYARGQV